MLLLQGWPQRTTQTLSWASLCSCTGLESFDQGKNRDRLAQNALTVAYTKRQQAGLECSPNQKSKAS